MNLFTVVNIAISLILVYLILSFIASQIQELIAILLQWRAKNLREAITMMLGENNQDAKLTQKFFEHPFIQTLNHQARERAESTGISYIPNKKFATILLDTIKNEDSTRPHTVQELIEHIENSIIPNNLKENISLFAKQAQSKSQETSKQIEELHLEIENWFDSVMASASTAYKNKAQGITLAIGLTMVILFNVDTVYIVNQLYKEQTLNSTLSQFAERIVTSHSQNTSCWQDIESQISDANCLATIRDDVNLVFDNLFTLPIGWNLSDPFKKQFNPLNIQNIVKVIMGWLLSALAISMGAPFWFNMLSKVINVNKAGKKI